MAQITISSIMAQLNAFDMGTEPDEIKTKWEPIKYTSMFWFLFINYLLVLAVLALLGLIAYSVWSLL